MTKVLRRKRADFIATGIITAVAVVGVGTVWATANIRHSHLEPAASTFSAEATGTVIPHSLSTSWTASAADYGSLNKPLVVGGVAISTETDGDNSVVRGMDPKTGQQLWEYSRNLPICSIGGAWGEVVVTYSDKKQCGDVVAITATTGQYKATRSDIAPSSVMGVQSNDAVGTYSRTRLELWRSDMVRTVEYGEVYAPQEPKMQPHQNCEINSVLTRKDLVAVANACQADGDKTRIVMMKRAPSDARKPETNSDITVNGTGAQIVAIGQTAAAVYVPPTAGSDKATILSIGSDGKTTTTTSVDPSPQISTLGQSDVYAPDVADLPHHITWFDGSRLYLFVPETMKVARIFTDALGTGVAMGDRLLIPVRSGIAVANWDTGAVDYIIPVDRGNYPAGSPVSLAIAGNTIIEKRGQELVALRSADAN
ncbi:MAG: hypothetical protein Q3962_02280 [Corynebacterium sp.]|nr:hypothetical protein [Corynebacterium sp.]